MRALVAVAGRRLTTLASPEDAELTDSSGDEISLSRLAILLARLTQSPPDMWLPTTSFGHTRHFFPVGTGSTGSAVFDAFAVVGTEKPLVYSWQNLPSLTAVECGDLDQLLARLSYFGRSESWCDATRHDNLPCWLGQTQSHMKCFPVRTADIPPDWKEHRDYDTVQKLAAVPDTNDEVDSIRRLLTRVVLNQQQRHRLQRTLANEGFPTLLLRCLLRQSGQDLTDGLERPIGTRWVHYAVPREVFQLPPPAPKPRAPASRDTEKVTLVRFALNTATVHRPVLPPVADTLLFADKFRAAALAWHNYVAQHTPEDRPHPRNLCGREADGSRINGHDHAFFWPTDEDDDGFIDHVSVFCPSGFQPVEVDALRRLLRIKQRGGRPDLLVTPVFLGDAKSFDPWKRETRTFISATPYFCPVHLGHGSKSGGVTRSLKEELQRSLTLTGVIQSAEELANISEIVFPGEADQTKAPPEMALRPASLNGGGFAGACLKALDVDVLPGMMRGLKVDNGVRFIPALAFCRRRRGHHINGIGRFLVIEFAQPRLARPFSAGSQCHFGLGLFVSVAPSPNDR